MNPFDVAVAGIAAGTIISVTGAYLKFLSTRTQQRASELAGGLDERLRRMEQALDAIAVEVERVSEGQRFTTRLLADRAPDVPRSPIAVPGQAMPGQAAPAVREVTHAR